MAPHGVLWTHKGKRQKNLCWSKSYQVEQMQVLEFRLHPKILLWPLFFKYIQASGFDMSSLWICDHNELCFCRFEKMISHVTYNQWTSRQCELWYRGKIVVAQLKWIWIVAACDSGWPGGLKFRTDDGWLTQLGNLFGQKMAAESCCWWEILIDQEKTKRRNAACRSLVLLLGNPG